MSNVDVMELQRMMKGTTGKDVEGLIFQLETGEWVAIFVSDRMMKAQVDYCPWCGKRLIDIGEHTH